MLYIQSKRNIFKGIQDDYKDSCEAFADIRKRAPSYNRRDDSDYSIDGKKDVLLRNFLKKRRCSRQQKFDRCDEIPGSLKFSVDGRWLMTGGRIDRMKKIVQSKALINHQYFTGTYGGWVLGSMLALITVDSMLRSKIHNIDIRFRSSIIVLKHFERRVVS